MKNLSVFIIFSFLYSCAIFGQKSDKKMVEECGILPHCVSSVDSRDSFKIAPLSHNHSSISKAKKELIDFLKKQERVEIKTNEENYVHATFKSEIMGFVDDVEFHFKDKVVHVRSISRVGISDLGVNRARIERIRKEIYK